MVLSDCVGSSGQKFYFYSGRIKNGGLSIGVAGGCGGVTETAVQLQSVLNGGGCESQQKWYLGTPSPTGAPVTPAPSAAPITSPPSAAPVTSSPSEAPTEFPLVFLPITSAWNPTMCIGLKDGDTAEDTELETYTCNAGDPAQNWAYDSVGQLRSEKASSMCMTSGGQGLQCFSRLVLVLTVRNLLLISEGSKVEAYRLE